MYKRDFYSVLTSAGLEDAGAGGMLRTYEAGRTANSWRCSVGGPDFRRRFFRIEMTGLVVPLVGGCWTIASAACAATFVKTRSAASSTWNNLLEALS